MGKEADDRDLSFRKRAAESVGLFAMAVRMVWAIGLGLLIGLTALLILQAIIPAAQLQFTRRAVDNLVEAAGLPGGRTADTAQSSR